MIDEKSFKEVSDAIRKTCSKVVSIQTKHPSALERRMKRLLNRNHIKYLFQSDMCSMVQGCENIVKAFYIANFYFPKKKLALEIEDSPRNITDSERDFIKSAEGVRTHDLGEISHKIQVLKITREDMDCPTFENELVRLLR